MGVTVRITGLDEVRDEFRDMVGHLPDRIESACVKAMQPMLSHVLAEVPRDTGTLAGAIKLKVGKPKPGRAKVGIVVAGKGKYGAHVTLGVKPRRWGLRRVLVAIGLAFQKRDDFMQRAFKAQGQKSADIAVAEILRVVE